METLRLSRATYQLVERGVDALEKVGRELERYNDRQERDRDQTTDDIQS
ncbi:hypothetical protein RH858_10640 [Halalkaliarchaeum sp. AArc-GB]|nr:MULTISPECIES: hypothetical protein [Halobacteria]MDR5673595.1 hypothetical protein [Halalkaliarchaeum sp. AArc-GB]